MKKHIGTRGMIGMPAIFIILGIILVGGIGYSVMKDPMGDGMEKKDVMMANDSMMKEGETMHKEGEWTPEEMEAMKKDDAMMKKEDPSMMKKDDAMMMEKPVDGAMMKKEEVMMEKPMDAAMYTGTVLAGKTSPLLDFTKVDYDAAVASGKLVTLFFYANWCPLCKAEFPKMMSAFDSYTGSDVVGFRVNYKDGETDADEKALAAQFGVAYQHTKVFVKGGKQVLKGPDTWDMARYTAEIAKYK